MRGANWTRPEAPYEVVKTMRASSLVLGPLVARTGRARVSMPGGCAIGARPINLHVTALEQLGRQGLPRGRLHRGGGARTDCRAPTVRFDRITVTGTEDLLMAAVLAQGETVIENAAREPEVADLADLLIKMGAQIEGAGTSTIRVRGVAELHGAEHTIIPDRIEAGTFLIAGAMTKGDLRDPAASRASGRSDRKMRQAGRRDGAKSGPETLRVAADGAAAGRRI